MVTMIAHNNIDADLTATDAWNTIDASAHGVPTGSYGVVVLCRNTEDPSTVNDCNVRAGGSTDARDATLSMYQKSTLTMIVPLGTGGNLDEFDVYIELTAADYDIYIVGHLSEDECHLYINAIDIGNTAIDTWEKPTLSVEGGDTMEAVIAQNIGTDNINILGLRYPADSTYVARHGADNSGCYCCKVDGVPDVETWTNNLVNKWWQHGYFKTAAGWTFHTADIERTTAVQDVYDDVVSPDATATACWYEFRDTTSTTGYVRGIGATEDYYDNPQLRVKGYMTELGTGAAAEHKINNSLQHLFERGWFAPEVAAAGKPHVGNVRCGNADMFRYQGKMA